MTAITYDRLYNELDRVLLNPVRLARVRSFARQNGEDPDALISDVRLAMWTAFRSYDWNAARGGVSALAERVLRHTLSDYKSARRRDRLVLDDGLEQTQGRFDPSLGVEAVGDLRCQEWFSRAYDSLAESRRAVFDLKWRPTAAFLDYVSCQRGKNTNVAIARYLGKRKVAVDWDLIVIYHALSALLLLDEFKDLRSVLVGQYGWPMAFSSRLDNDRLLVEQIANEYKLRLEPNAPPRREFADNASRVIETYDWGCICYLRLGQATATLVILGVVNWLENRVWRQNGSLSLTDVLDWYQRLDSALKGADMQQIPRCFGEHDPSDNTCKGDPVAKNKSDRAPCGMRDRCVAFELLCGNTKTKPPDHLDYEGEDGEEQASLKDESKILPALDKLILAHEIVNGKIRSKKPKLVRRAKMDSEHQSNAAKAKPVKQFKAAAKAASEALEPKREATAEMATWYLKRLAEASGLKIQGSHGDAESGDLYLVDRTESSGYVSVYCKTNTGGRMPVTSLQTRPRLGCVEVRVAAEFARWKGAAELKAEDYTGKDGAFKIRLRGLGKGDLALVAKEVANLIKQGAISALIG